MATQAVSAFLFLDLGLTQNVREQDCQGAGYMRKFKKGWDLAGVGATVWDC